MRRTVQTDPLLIQDGVFPGHFQRSLIQIHTDDFVRVPQCFCLNRETSRVAAEVQDGFAGAEICQPSAVFALIAEEA